MYKSKEGSAGRRNMIGMILLIALAIFLGACGEQNAKVDIGEGEYEEVTVILDYVPNTNHTGMYVANEKNFYEEEGLVVKIIEAGDNMVSPLIATGKGDFGISHQEDVTYALTAEEPLPIKSIATIIQHNTSGFASYEGKNIKRAKDFEGKSYAGWGAPSEEAVIKAVMTADGGDPSKIQIIASDEVDYSVLKDKVDLKWIFWGWDGIAAERAGVKLNYIELKKLDERLDYYSPLIVASNKTLDENPELVKKFLRATEKGYKYAIENSDEAAEILSENVTMYDIDMLKESQQYLSEQYINDGEDWGIMKDSVWDGYTDFMMEYGLIAHDIPAKECYTNEFLGH